jgi:hypothetical protein
MSAPRRSRRLTAISPNEVYLNPDIRESDAEALARHRAYYDAAYATLSPARHLLTWGTVAGLLTSLTLTAGLAIFLALLVNFEIIVLQRNPSSWGTPTNPPWIGFLRPALGSLALLPWLGLAGAASAWLRRWGHQRVQTLQHYFRPETPKTDEFGFWFFMVLALWVGFWLAGLIRANADPVGVLIYMLMAGFTLTWPLHRLWLAFYLTLITHFSPITTEQIQALVMPQLGPRDDGPILQQWRRQVQTLFEARRARQASRES